MKLLSLLSIACTLLISCGTTSKLDVPSKFEEQSDKFEVKGARSRHISFGNFKTTKIKRGWNIHSSRYGKRYLVENLLLGQVGIRKIEIIEKQKDKFSFTLSDGQKTAEVYAREFEGNKSDNYRLGILEGIAGNIRQMQQYKYSLSAAIITDTASGSWQMILGNAYDRKYDSTKSLFPLFDNSDNGFATNGKDTIFIRSLNLKKAVGPYGKEAKYPVKILSGYELRIDDGVAAIVDNIGMYVWFYKELDDSTKLIVSSIAVTIFAKRIKDVKW